MESTENKINNAISNHKRGKLFFPNDFSKSEYFDELIEKLKTLNDEINLLS